MTCQFCRRMEIFQLFLDEDFQQWSTIDLLDLIVMVISPCSTDMVSEGACPPRQLDVKAEEFFLLLKRHLAVIRSEHTPLLENRKVASDMSHVVTACHWCFDFKWYFVWYPWWSKVVLQVPRFPLGLWAMRCLGTNGWSKTWRAVVTGEGFFAPNHGWCLFCTWSLSHG